MEYSNQHSSYSHIKVERYHKSGAFSFWFDATFKILRMKSITMVAALLSGIAYTAPSTGLQRTAGRPLAVHYKNMHDYAPVSNENTKQTEYFSNWSGLIQSGQGITAVYGYVIAPAISAPGGGNTNTDCAGSAWVGIGGVVRRRWKRLQP